MKRMASAFLALSLLAGAAGTAAAYEGSFIQYLDEQGRGGHQT
jgi:hypothetical protein